MSSDTEGARTIRLWTAQAQVVIDALDSTGVYRVRRSFVDEKYGDVAWAFQKAYGFYVREASKIVERPDGAESAVWCYRHARWAPMDAGATILQLEVPREQVVLFDLRAWNRILNLQYIPRDKDDERAWKDELRRQGIRNVADVFSTSFYPLLRRKIEGSWPRLFFSAKGIDDTYVQAGLWELRREWVVARMQFGGRLGS